MLCQRVVTNGARTPEATPLLGGRGAVDCWMTPRTPLTGVHIFAVAESTLPLVVEATDLRAHGRFHDRVVT